MRVECMSELLYIRCEMHRRICHALHDVHLVARMPRAFLNYISEKEFPIVRGKTIEYGLSIENS